MTELAEPFAMTQPAISKHLKVLEKAGLVSRRRDAQRRPCRLEADALRAATEWLDAYRRYWAERYERLDALLDQLQRDDRHDLGRTPAMSQTATLDVSPSATDAMRIMRSFARARASSCSTPTRSPSCCGAGWARRPGRSPSARSTSAPGGTFRYVMHGPDGAEMVLHGEYREVDPPVRLVATESFSDDWTGGETLNTTTFDEVGGITTVTVFVEYASAASRDEALATGMEAGHGRGLRPPRRPRGRSRPDGDIGTRYRRRADRFDALVAAVDADRLGRPRRRAPSGGPATSSATSSTCTA